MGATWTRGTPAQSRQGRTPSRDKCTVLLCCKFYKLHRITGYRRTIVNWLMREFGSWLPTGINGKGASLQMASQLDRYKSYPARVHCSSDIT